IGNIDTDLALGAGLVDSCAGCHGRPCDSADVEGNVVTWPDSRDAPHLFGLGLKEMLADEIAHDLRAIRDAALAVAKQRGRPITHTLQSKGIQYGAITALPDGSVDTSRVMECALPLEPVPYDPTRAKRLLAEAGYPNGFDTGDFNPQPPFYSMAETIGNYLAAIGIRIQIRTMERAAFMTTWREKKLKGLLMVATAASGHAATRIEAFVVSTGTYAYGGLPDLDELFRQQAVERNRSKRQALLHQTQRLMSERVMHAPVFEPATLHGVGPRVAEPAVGLNAQLYFAAPYEGMRLRKP